MGPHGGNGQHIRVRQKYDADANIVKNKMKIHLYSILINKIVETAPSTTSPASTAFLEDAYTLLCHRSLSYTARTPETAQEPQEQQEQQ